MNNFCFLPLALCLVLSGCRDKSASARLDKMDIQLAKLELAVSQAKEDAYQARQENIKTLENEESNLVSTAARMEGFERRFTNAMWADLQLGQQVLLMASNYDRLTNAAARPLPMARGPAAVPAARPAAASALRAGIPATVFEAIAADAEKRFPGDYEEQVYIINEQVTAYKKLHP